MSCHVTLRHLALRRVILRHVLPRRAASRCVLSGRGRVVSSDARREESGRNTSYERTAQIHAAYPHTAHADTTHLILTQLTLIPLTFTLPTLWRRIFCVRVVLSYTDAFLPFICLPYVFHLNFGCGVLQSYSSLLARIGFPSLISLWAIPNVYLKRRCVHSLASQAKELGNIYETGTASTRLHRVAWWIAMVCDLAHSYSWSRISRLIFDNPRFVDAQKVFSMSDTVLRIDDLKI